MRLNLARREAIDGYLFLLPWILGFLIFTAGPVLASFLLGFTDWNGTSPIQFYGIGNYLAIFQDHLFWQSLKVTLAYSVGYIPLSGIFAMVIALLMNQRVPGITVFRTIYYLPAVVSGAAVAVLWNFVFNREYGVLNWFVGLFGIQPIPWLQSETWVVVGFIIMGLWGIGGGMLILLAALQGIPTELYEAASIDGANQWRKFWNITVPMTSPALFFNLVTGIIGTLQIFTSAYIITRGGPNYATYFYALNIYLTAFSYLRLGYASALAWILFVIILALTLIVFKWSNSWVYYAGEREDFS